MAFNKTSMTSRLVNIFGAVAEVEVGMSTMASGTATVKAAHLARVDGVIGMVQGATGVGETVICTATSGNQFTLETINEAGATAGSSVVMWLAWGVPKA